MDKKIRIYPAKGLKIPLPGSDIKNREYVPEDGIDVDPSVYWSRRLRNKDVLLAPPSGNVPKTEQTKNSKKKKEDIADDSAI